MAKKLPREVKLIQEHILPERNGGKSISYSQWSTYSNCPHQWYLSYVKNLSPYKASIHTSFGTSLHEVLQTFLKTAYEVGVKVAEEMDFKALLKERMVANYQEDVKASGGEHFSNKQELSEFYYDGVAILEYVIKKRKRFFSTKNTFLVGVEIPLFYQISENKNIFFKGFIDLVFYNTFTEKYYILDIKTSTRGWSDYEKKNETKTSQIILYKEYFALQFNVDVEKIDVEYFIVRRKVPENSDWPVYRVQQFAPASGKIKRNQSVKKINDFITDAFDDQGNYIDKDYLKQSSKSSCIFCPFKGNLDLCDSPF
jgi:CRISPR/Cas system-associated exonuclease Cas4 (RecB family)